LGKIEDHPSYAHNHFMALGDFKPGIFRKLVHALALWGIKMIIIFYYRPGFVINMGTIHYARWFRLPGTDRSIFLSNYDGSWDSYLEDFITRARWGQTGAWSNWQGFPETKYLIFKGAQDGDRFKRWVRTKQQVVPFWYSRFPHLTTDQIRNNALIHHGIARAQTDREAREWLRCFGSMPRVANQIETDEVQSIVFRGMRDLKYSCCMILKLPEIKSSGLGDWLKALSGGKVKYRSNSARAQLLKPIESLLFEEGNLGKLRPSLRVTFGDTQIMGEEALMLAQPLGINPLKANVENTSVQIEVQQTQQSQFVNMRRRATFLAWSAHGFRKFQTGENALHDLPEAFPPAFKIGMGQRSRILGDIDAGSPENWRWSDIPGPSKEGAQSVAAEAALMLYADNEQELVAMKQAHSTLLLAYGGQVISETDCSPAWPDNPEKKGRDHFGYRDGISQPVMRGTERFSKGVPQRDIVEPGEIILGYASNQGFFPPSPLIRAEDDLGGDLPVPTKSELSRFPDFGVERAGAMPRDFGRNGSFVVIRELRQDVETFNKFVKKKAKELQGTSPRSAYSQTAYPNLRDLAGQDPDQEWIKAKLMGRWPDGRPLVGNPLGPPNNSSDRGDDTIENSVRQLAQFHAERDNDFSYGIDDPQGFACPFGAHIRRANPRDSKEPGDEWEQTITNRHRLLRRGRSYTRIDENGEKEKGLLFVALCADLERQFEFVQQTWINSPNFHGLSNEPDPIIGSTKPMNGEKSSSFTIPTPAGPVELTGMENFVEIRAGGYFFLPSRSALTFLKECAFRSAGD
jgi:Dyp-type peroxidase family